MDFARTRICIRTLDAIGLVRQGMVMRSKARILAAIALLFASIAAQAQTTLANGVPVNGTTNSTTSNSDFRDYTFTLPAAATDLSVVLDQLSGDVDLYVRLGQTPTLSLYDCRPYLSGTSAETCTFSLPTAGTWFVRVYGFDLGPQSFRITATWTNPLITLQNGVPVNGSTNSSSSNSDFRDYTFSIPAGSTNLSVVIDQLTGDLDLYVRFGQMPTLALYDCRPFSGGTNAETCLFPTPAAGTWFARVYGFAGGPQSFRITATWTSASGSPGGSWISIGPAPALNGDLQGIPGNPTAGAINAVAAHPSNVDILHVASVNGGIWSTTNATSVNPEWTYRSGNLPSLSMRTIRFDPLSTQRMVAGTGRNSSLGSIGGALYGLYRSFDGGASWQPIVNATLSGKQIVGAEERGEGFFVATDAGFFSSTTGGATFSLISGNGSSGLPAGRNSDLAADPTDIGTLYVSVLGPTVGIYQSFNLGAFWTKVSNAAVDATLNSNGHVRLSVGQSGQLWAAVVGTNGQLAAVFRRLTDGTWSNLGVPTTVEGGGTIEGLHPGGQGRLHLAVVADPTNVNIVYVGGDRQPCFSSTTCFPNSLGATSFGGRLFRGTVGASPAWDSITNSDTGNNSGPHADSRGLAFDADGNLLLVCDGGIYKRTSPRSSTGVWRQLNGSLAVTEFHGIAFDGVSDMVFGGAQDNGTSRQRSQINRVFETVLTGDGGDPATDDVSSATTSSRYASFQNFAGFTRQTFDAAGQPLSASAPPLTPIAPSPAIVGSFVTPIAINRVNGLRLIILAANGVYESANQGSTVTRISTIVGNAFVGDPLVYGVPGNVNFLYVGSGTGVYLRTTAAGSLAFRSNPSGATVVDVAADTTTPTRLFAMDANAVFLSIDSAGSFSNITGNLGGFGAGQFRSMAFVPRSNGNLLAVGTDRGVYYALAPSYNNWALLGTGLPPALAYELDYHPGRDALVAGMFGAGAWRLNGLSPTTGSPLIFANGFE